MLVITWLECPCYDRLNLAHFLGLIKKDGERGGESLYNIQKKRVLFGFEF